LEEDESVVVLDNAVLLQVELVLGFAFLLENGQSGQVVHLEIHCLFHRAFLRLSPRSESEFLFLVVLRKSVELTVTQRPKVFYC
jgi:hypothetical protein